MCAPETYLSVVHCVVLSGITISDTAALNKLAFEQMKEMWKVTKESDVLEGKKHAAEADKAANRQRQREPFDQLLPQLRPLVPANQQATFDQNLKALQASDYAVVITDLPDDVAPKDPKDPNNVLSRQGPVDVRIGCLAGCTFS